MRRRGGWPLAHTHSRDLPSRLAQSCGPTTNRYCWLGAATAPPLQPAGGGRWGRAEQGLAPRAASCGPGFALAPSPQALWATKEGRPHALPLPRIEDTFRKHCISQNKAQPPSAQTSPCPTFQASLMYLQETGYPVREEDRGTGHVCTWPVRLAVTRGGPASHAEPWAKCPKWSRLARPPQPPRPQPGNQPQAPVTVEWRCGRHLL